jgi:hypothetical protein
LQGKKIKSKTKKGTNGKQASSSTEKEPSCSSANGNGFDPCLINVGDADTQWLCDQEEAEFFSGGGSGGKEDAHVQALFQKYKEEQQASGEAEDTQEISNLLQVLWTLLCYFPTAIIDLKKLIFHAHANLPRQSMPSDTQAPPA